MYFIGIFGHLEGLELLHDATDPLEEDPGDDQTLIPHFVSPLRGRLTVKYFTKEGLLKDMLVLLGGIRFRSMDLPNANGMRFLLDACAERLETLGLHPTDPRGRENFQNYTEELVENFVAVPPHWDFDLSQNESLRALEVDTVF